MDVIKDRGFVSVDVYDSTYEASTKMTKAGRDVALVMREHHMAGIITATDILFKVVAKGLDPTKIPAGAAMSSPVQNLVVTELTLVNEARVLMNESNIRHLPVIEQGEVVGILETLDIANHKHDEEIRRAMESGYAMRSAH
jgi:signal-transduction protein with cAMP-binding, CBS, and nucleotidyltransferase domain